MIREGIAQEPEFSESDAHEHPALNKGDEDAPERGFPIVGIGASAGGLEAFFSATFKGQRNAGLQGSI
jgi:chemotaxis response regulator CheB